METARTVRVVAGDVGGTKTLLALCEVQGASVRPLRVERHESRAWSSFDALLRSFATRETAGHAQAACVGVAGPVEDDACRATNLPWSIDAAGVASALGVARARLVNDFFAAASGIAALADSDLVTLQAGSPRIGAPRVVIGAGTGLGEALLVPVGDRWTCVPGEGGHADFAARSPLEARLADALRERYGRVSWERVASGMGLADVYAFLRDREGIPASPEVEREMAAGDAGAVIGAHALAGDDPLCRAAMAIFLGAYGAEAGNAALRVLARGGVFLAGGIAARVLPLMQRGDFLAAFNDKGRMSLLARGMPVHVVTDPLLGLKGAAMLAAASVTPSS